MKTLQRLLATVLVAGTALAHAAPVYWTDWQTSNPNAAGFEGHGVITTTTATVNVTYTNRQGIGFSDPGSGFDYWAHGTPYTSSAVDNRPTGSDQIALSRAGSQTLQVSQAIANPGFAFFHPTEKQNLFQFSIRLNRGRWLIRSRPFAAKKTAGFLT